MACQIYTSMTNICKNIFPFLIIFDNMMCNPKAFYVYNVRPFYGKLALLMQ